MISSFLQHSRIPIAGPPRGYSTIQRCIQRDLDQRFYRKKYDSEKIIAAFGGGPRQCIGNSFALLEAQIILPTIIQRYRLELALGWTVEPEALVTLRPKGGLWMVVEEAAGL